MRSRFALFAGLSLLFVSLGIGCRTLCAIEQWKCDTFGTCAFGTTPSYGTFAPPGPYPQPTVTPAPGTTNAPTFQSGPVLGTPTDLTPSSPPAVPSF